MRLAIISDVHANLEALIATLEDIADQSIDRVVCLGDMIGYNANPVECLTLIREVGALCVAGNHDRAVAGQMSTNSFSNTAARAVSWTRGQLSADAIAFISSLPAETSIEGQLVAVHGALHPPTEREFVRLDNDERRQLSFEALLVHPSKARICAHGHTHQLGVFELQCGVMKELLGDEINLRSDAYYLINPGSVGHPRNVDPRATYLLLDLERQVVKIRRVEYDTTAAVAKTRRAGLLPLSAYLPPRLRKSLRRSLLALRL